MGFFQIWPCDFPRKNSSTFSLYCTTQHTLIQGCCTTFSGACEKCLFAPDSAWQIKDWFCTSLGEPTSLLDWLPGAWVTQNNCKIGNPIIRMYNDTADAAHGVPPSANLLSVVYISQKRVAQGRASRRGVKVGISCDSLETFPPFLNKRFLIIS